MIDEIFEYLVKNDSNFIAFIMENEGLTAEEIYRKYGLQPQ